MSLEAFYVFIWPKILLMKLNDDMLRHIEFNIASHTSIL